MTGDNILYAVIGAMLVAVVMIGYYLLGGRKKRPLKDNYTGEHWLYLNIAEDNFNSFVPAWAAYRGVLATPNVALNPEAAKTHLGLTPHLARLFRNRNRVALEKELAIEDIRRIKFPNAVSRLSCIYCWPDEATARLAPQFWSNQGKHFDDRYLVQIGVNALRPPTIVDTRWIDRFVINSQEPLERIGIDWIEEYWRGSRYPWSGEADIPREPLMECLVDGTAVIYGTELRMEAFSLVERHVPDSIGVLEKGRLGVDLCTRFDGTDEWRLGQIVPVLMTDRDRKVLQFRYLLLADEKLAAAVNRKVSLVGIKPEEINSRALERGFGKGTFSVPDLRPLEADLSWISDDPRLFQQVNVLLTAFFLEAGGNIELARKVQEEQLAKMGGTAKPR
jgi:hypothetical protein